MIFKFIKKRKSPTIANSTVGLRTATMRLELVDRRFFSICHHDAEPLKLLDPVERSPTQESVLGPLVFPCYTQLFCG